MRLVNRTPFNTKQLGKLIRETLRREMVSKGYLENVSITATMRRSRSRGPLGRAAYGTFDDPYRAFRLFLHQSDTPRVIAEVVAHESAHNHGVRHRHMAGSYKWKEPEAWAWADAFPVRMNAPKLTKPTFRQWPDAAKLAHAEKMLQRAETRAKRARTIERNWRVKVRYYGRRLAAKAAPVDPPTPDDLHSEQEGGTV